MTAPRSRVGTALGASALSIALLAGCSSGGSGTGGSDSGETTSERPEQVDLTVGVWGGAERADLYQQVLDKFAETQEGVTAEMEFADQGPYFERLTTEAASKSLPDVFFLTDIYFGRYAENDALLDLTPFIGEQIDDSNIGENWLAYGQRGDGVFALPTNFNGQAVLIDQNVFDERGLTYDVESWEDLADLGREVARPGEGYYGLVDPTTGTTQRPFEVWVRQHGQELYSEDGQLGFDQDVLVDWWEYWAELRDEGVVPPAAVQVESEAQGLTNDLIVKGQAAIRLSSATHLSAAGNLRGGGLSLQDYPEIDDVAEDWRFFTALLLAASANTPAPEVAAELMNTILNDIEANEVTKISMGTPTSPEVAEEIAPLLEETDQAVVEYLTEQQSLPTRPSPPLPETSEQFTSALSRFSQEVAYGRMTPADAAEALFEDAESYLG